MDFSANETHFKIKYSQYLNYNKIKKFIQAVVFDGIPFLSVCRFI